MKIIVQHVALVLSSLSIVAGEISSKSFSSSRIEEQQDHDATRSGLLSSPW
jgi:hypothetical protein